MPSPEVCGLRAPPRAHEPAALAARKSDEVTFIFYEDGQMKRQQVARADAQRRANEANQLRKDLVEVQRTIRKDGARR